jgi:hypothetical protein
MPAGTKDDPWSHPWQAQGADGEPWAQVLVERPVGEEA